MRPAGGSGPVVTNRDEDPPQLSDDPAPTASAPASAGSRDQPRPSLRPVPFYWWPLWMAFLAAALILFYAILTPIWMGVRLIVWVSERGRVRGRQERPD